jgi:hypothetical protein
MKKIRFKPSKTPSYHLKLDPETMQRKLQPIALDSWRIDDHLCVQRSTSKDAGWFIAVYPWGSRLTRDFYAKMDAIALAKALHELTIPWIRMRSLDSNSAEYRKYVTRIINLIAECDTAGLLMPVK